MDAKINEMQKSTAQRKTGAQSGQAIVLIALAMVALLGVTGLALDGGSLLFLQRKAQTVADLAAMSAAVAKCDDSASTDPEAAALLVAAANEISADDVTVSFPNETDVSVVVQLPKDPYFIQVVYRGPMMAEGRSVTRCRVDGSSWENPYADAVLFATSEVCDDTLHTQGNYGFYEGSLRSNREVYLNAMNSGDASPANVTITGTVNYVTQAGPLHLRDYIDRANPPRREGYYGMSIAGYPTLNHMNLNDNSGEGLIDELMPTDAPLLYNIDDFGPAVNGVRPEGTIWASIPANLKRHLPGNSPGNYYAWPGFAHHNPLPTNSGAVQGLYFVEGDLYITDGNGVQMNNLSSLGVTIVATGRIHFNGGPLALKPYYSNLTMMSGYGTGTPYGYQNYDVGDSVTTGGNCGGGQSSTSNAINLPVQQGGVSFGTIDDPGLLYAPWGKVHFGTGNVGPTYGQVIAYVIQSDHYSTAIRYRPATGGGGTNPSPQGVSFVQ